MSSKLRKMQKAIAAPGAKDEYRKATRAFEALGEKQHGDEGTELLARIHLAAKACSDATRGKEKIAYLKQANKALQMLKTRRPPASVREIMTGDTAMAVFPYTTPDGRTVVDEECECGCLRTKHASRGEAMGHGLCFGCSKCSRFRWAAHVMEATGTLESVSADGVATVKLDQPQAAQGGA